MHRRTKQPTVKASKLQTRRRRRKEENYNTYIYKVLKAVTPSYGISIKAMAIMNSFVKDMFVRLADEASRLAMLSKRSTLSCRDVEAAVRLVCSGELKLHAASEGTKAFARYTAKN
ncbi:late histone H2B.L4-like [Panulirus ornatus]|uniref:late histone H2B.L4-like n=1 Tax=Panulirus ornatus TaxID=150431 RepID=UPI003A8AE7E8